MKLLSLCTGYGGLDLAVEAFFDCELVACAEIDKYAGLAIDKHFKVPNLGDIKLIDWTSLGDIDIMTAGYPCQPFSHAGNRKGTKDERHIWPYIKDGIGILRPSLVVLENVRGHLSLGFKEVLQDLASIGYDAIWTVVRASDVGAPHQRARLFTIAYPNITGSQRWNKALLSTRKTDKRYSDKGTSSDPNSDACKESRRIDRSIHQKASEIKNWTDRNEHGSCCQLTTDADRHEQQGNRQVQGLGRRFDTRYQMRMRRSPNPLDLNGKLNEVFVEYMMGLPVGWVTDLPISRAQKLKMLGNGVVPQQAFYALEKLWAIKEAF